jgi:hypothetical protein
MSKKFWYRDNWVGKKKEFDTYKEAKKSASEETGVTIAIYESNGKLYKIVEASGFTPA